MNQNLGKSRTSVVAYQLCQSKKVTRPEWNPGGIVLKRNPILTLSAASLNWPQACLRKTPLFLLLGELNYLMMPSLLRSLWQLVKCKLDCPLALGWDTLNPFCLVLFSLLLAPALSSFYPARELDRCFGFLLSRVPSPKLLETIPY